MDAPTTTEASAKATTQARTTTERVSDRELVVTGTIDGPATSVFEAWTDPNLVKRWWVPRSLPITLVGCEMDVRVGGSYRFTFQVDPTTTMAFFGRYLEVDPPRRLVWTNEESGDEAVITTATFDERDGRTHLTIHDLYPSKAALDEAIASGSTAGWDEQLGQLEELLAVAD